MFFNNFSKDDPYGDIQKREEYERQQKLNLAKGAGNFLYKYIINTFIFFFSTIFVGTIIATVFNLDINLSLLIGIIAGIVIFRVPYVKESPIKSLAVICFVFALFTIAF